MTPHAMIVVRGLGVTRALLGLALVVRPDRTAAAVAGPVGPPPAWLVRALGARLVVQSGIELAHPTPTVLRVGAAVDAAHAASMIPLAAGHRHRRVAAISGGFAALSSGLAVWISGHRRQAAA